MTFQAGKNLDNRADARGKVWQRWNDQVIGGAWDGSLKRYVYDGGQLVQEHLWDVMEDQGSWVYSYNDIDRDYLRHQGGIRQREGTAASYNDFYLQQSGSSIEIKTQRDQASATIARAERTQSLNQMAGTTFTDISNLATSNSPIAMFGGGTSGGTAGFDGLMQRGGRPYLAGLSRFTSRMGNNAYAPVGYKGPLGTGATKGADWDPVADMYSVGYLFGGDDPYPGCKGIYGGPELPDHAECCPEGPECAKRQYAMGWFEYCCCHCSVASGNTSGTGTYCPPEADCTKHEVGHDCNAELCRWSFGIGKNCPATPLNIIGCDNWKRGTEVFNLNDAINSAFKDMCKAAMNCACKTYWNDEWRTRISNEGFAGHNWLSIWACIARYCREGGLTIKCEDIDNSAESKTGVASITINPNKLQSIGNNILHELFHVCGIFGSGPGAGLLQFGWLPGELYPEDKADKVSVPAWISNQCLKHDHSTYNYLSKTINSEIILQPSPTFPYTPELY